MRSKLRRVVIPATLLTVAGALLIGTERVRAENSAAPQTPAGSGNAGWGRVSVAFPVSTRQFPAGEGAVIANSQCLICHSAGMVLTQPARTQAEWKETINKMRSAYGAPIPTEQIDALALYLSRLAPDSEASAALSRSTGPTSADAQRTAEHAAGSAAPADGASIFMSRCAACHQTAGTGLRGVFPPLAGSNWVNGRDTAVVQILLHGLQGTLTVNGVAYQGVMPAFGDQMSDAEIAAVLTYIRDQWGNKAGAVSKALVRTQRAASAARTEPWNGEADLARMK